MIASCTHLKLKGLMGLFGFILLAPGTAKQLVNSKGLVFKDLKSTSLFDHWTLSVWESKKDMLGYVNNGTHLKAMKKFRDIADTVKSKVVSWEVSEIPSWQEAMQRNIELDYDYEKSAAAKLS